MIAAASPSPADPPCLRGLHGRRWCAAFAPSGRDHFLQVTNRPLQVILFQREGCVLLRQPEGVRRSLEGQDQILGQPRLGDVPVHEPIPDGGLDGIVVHAAGEQQARGAGNFLFGDLENFQTLLAPAFVIHDDQAQRAAFHQVDGLDWILVRDDVEPLRPHDLTEGVDDDLVLLNQQGAYRLLFFLNRHFNNQTQDSNQSPRKSSQGMHGLRRGSL
ncbi:MAG: hypothetical protein ACI8QI_000631 [Limisphaerales bacterium]|jgi:hypothetical protein